VSALRSTARAVLALLVALGAVLALAAPAQAHGEQTQEAFLRASTALLYDVQFSTTELDVGDELVVTGKVRVMESWPSHTIAAPETGFLSLVMPGPVFAIKDRQLSGMFTPQSVEIEKGSTYSLSVTAIAREPGRWHVHPSFAVEGTGTLAGRGEWITVGPGRFTNTVRLASGEKIDLTTYGFGRVALWHLIAFGIGLAWLGYWIAQPVLARAAVVEADQGSLLIRRRDLVAGGVAALVALGTIGIGYVVTNATLPTTLMPPQVVRLAPPPLAEAPALVSTSVAQAAWRSEEGVLELMVKVHNTSPQPVSLTRMQVAEESLAVGGPVTVSPAVSTAPGTTETLTVRIDGETLKKHNLLPLKDPQVRITGLLFFADPTGKQQVTEVNELTSPILPQ